MYLECRVPHKLGYKVVLHYKVVNHIKYGFFRRFRDHWDVGHIQ